MIRTSAVLLLFLLTPLPLAAQTAGDYGVSFLGYTPPRMPVHSLARYAIEVTKPPNAGEVVVELEIPGDDVTPSGFCSGSKPLRCTVPPQIDTIFVDATMDTPGTFTATARVIAPNDPNPLNDRATRTVEVVDAPSLVVSIHAGRHDAASEGEVFVGVLNRGAAASDVVLTVTLPAEGMFTGRIVAADESVTCTVTASTVVCSRPSLATGTRFDVRLGVALPERFDGGTVPVTASVRSSVADVDPADDTDSAAITLIPQIVVTNANDEGAGSLRQALLESRVRCATELCTIGFRIPVSAPGQPVVIQPRSELPQVLGEVKVDGSTQTRFGGDTNPNGPEIVIDGSHASEHSRGLLLGGPSCEMYVLDLAVVNFPGPGIVAERGLYDSTCKRFLFPNTVIARNHLSGNYRGLALVGPGYATVSDNVISGNRRAGIFADRFSYAHILRNRVTDNGASGIFLHLVNPFRLLGARVEENVISGNAEWGIARVPVGDAEIRRNSIFGNRYLAIDAGLDLETPNAPADAHADTGVPNKPVLISAHYDAAANKTIVRGRLDSVTAWQFTIDFYASASLSTAGHAEAERWLASLTLPRSSGHADLVMELAGDLRGQYITATNTRTHVMFLDEFVFDTSEISNAVLVQ